MSIELPDTNLIIKEFPQIKALTHVATGGFKAVYKAEIAGIVEALKLLQIPENENANDDEIRKEFIGRIEREILALEKCQVPELVKLGSLTPQIITFSGNLNSMSKCPT